MSPERPLTAVTQACRRADMLDKPDRYDTLKVVSGTVEGRVSYGCYGVKNDGGV